MCLVVQRFRMLPQTWPYLFWSCCVPDVGLCMNVKFLMSPFFMDGLLTNQIVLLLPVRGRTEFRKIFGIDCRRFLSSPPLTTLCSLQARSFARSLVRSLRLEKERKRLLRRLPMLRLAISSASLHLLSETLHENLLVIHAKQTTANLWRKPLCVRRRQSRTGRVEPPRWLPRKIFFWPISGTEFEHFWNWFRMNKCPGLFRSWSKLSHENIALPKISSLIQALGQWGRSKSGRSTSEISDQRDPGEKRRWRE